MIIQKKNSPKQILNKIKGLIKPSNYTVVEANPSIKILRDVHIPLRDGSYVSANIYMPGYEGKFPVLLSLYSGRKDVLCKDGHMHIQYRFARQPQKIVFSDETSFEAPDPNYWTANGYIMINIDKRGFGISPKATKPQNFFDDDEILDIYDSVEWAGIQEWCNGNVGLLGVSYLAINQYKVAALTPPHLKAICPWEGVSDLYRDWFYHGGVREDGFTPFFSKRVLTMGDAVDMRKLQLEHETRDEYWKSFAPELEKITVPMLNCISYSCQMFHSAGSYRAYQRVGSKQKWLYTHRNGEWTEYYSIEANATMLKFFDYFLKGINNGMEDYPKVRLEIREFGDCVKEVRYEDQFPPKNVVWKSLYLSNESKSLTKQKMSQLATQTFDLKNDSNIYTYTFEGDTEIVGPMKLTLFVELEGCSDANLFVGIQKFHQGKEVEFEGVYGFPNDLVARSALRVALRTVNEELSTPYTPEYDFDDLKPLSKNEIAKLEFKFSPSGTFYRKGDEMKLVVQGQYFISSQKIHQPFSYKGNAEGRCKILSSDQYVSELFVPLIEK